MDTATETLEQQLAKIIDYDGAIYNMCWLGNRNKTDKKLPCLV